MWVIELGLSSDPARLAARPAHRTRLAALHRDGVVRMAGPLAGDDGALIIMDAPDRETVEAVLAADPYLATPGVELLHIRQWHPFLR
jgi:uncharacterized protein YciI